MKNFAMILPSTKRSLGVIGGLFLVCLLLWAWHAAVDGDANPSGWRDPKSFYTGVLGIDGAGGGCDSDPALEDMNAGCSLAPPSLADQVSKVVERVMGVATVVLGVLLVLGVWRGHRGRRVRGHAA